MFFYVCFIETTIQVCFYFYTGILFLNQHTARLLYICCIFFFFETSLLVWYYMYVAIFLFETRMLVYFYMYIMFFCCFFFVVVETNLLIYVCCTFLLLFFKPAYCCMHFVYLIINSFAQSIKICCSFFDSEITKYIPMCIFSILCCMQNHEKVKTSDLLNNL